MNRHRLLLRANAVYLGIGALNGLFVMDIPGIFFQRGPATILLGPSTDAGIGLIEAHGLALLMSIAFWHAPPVRFWHLLAGTTGALLGISNIVFWQGFIKAGIVPTGYVATAFHLTFAILQIGAAVRAQRGEGRAHDVHDVHGANAQVL
jgi:hypothetical protein